MRGFSQPPSVVDQATTTLAWPNTPPYRSVGDPRRAPWGKAEDVPVPVYRAALHLLGGTPSTWYILNDVNFAGEGQRVVLMQSNTATFCCLVDPTKWVQLNIPGGIPCINDVIGSFLQPSDVLHHTQRLNAYIEHVAFLYRGPQRIALTKRFRHDVEKEGIKDWLHGTEKSSQIFLSLFHDSSVTRYADQVSIVSHVINSRGAVEEWTLFVKMNKRVEISDINVQQVRIEGTFSFAYVE